MVKFLKITKDLIDIKEKIIYVIYKCKNYRRNEYINKNISNKNFCNATIIYIPKNQNIKSGYFIKQDHSEACYDLYINNIKKNTKKKDRSDFTLLCENVMNTSNIYDRKIYKEHFKNIYNEKKFNFPLNNNILNSIITIKF